MNTKTIDQWLASVDSLIRSLDLVEPGVLPDSFSKDILEPLETADGLASVLRVRLRVFEFLRQLPEIKRVADGRVWHFWDAICRWMCDFARAGECAVWRMGQDRVLFRLHPLSPEEKAVESVWPKGKKENLTTSPEESYSQSWLLRLDTGHTCPIVLQFMTKAPAPRINQAALEELARFGGVLSEFLMFFVPERVQPKIPAIEFDGRPQSIVENIGEEDQEGSEWTILKTGDIYGSDPGMLAALASAEHAAESDATVFFRGESGTGKELFAQHLHNLSARKDGPFVPINCSAIPSELIESEMFGHEKGSFTGAYYRKIGKVEQAHGGTLFLDEIGEMPLGFQAKLLRYLQEKNFCRVGGTKAIHSDARIVVATHRDLLDMVAAKTFREDLYYRINVIPIKIPPLRDRGGDVRKLARIFFSKFIGKSRASRRTVDERVFDVLERYPFPGNVRELENVVQRTVVMTQKPQIELDDLPADLFKDQSRSPVEMFKRHPFEAFDGIIPESRDHIRALRKDIEQIAITYHRDLERRFMLKVLEQTNYNAAQAAKMIGVNRTLFYKLVRRSGINLASLKDDGSLRDKSDSDLSEE